MVKGKRKHERPERKPKRKNIAAGAATAVKASGSKTILRFLAR